MDMAIYVAFRPNILNDTKKNEISDFFIFSDGVIVFWNIRNTEVLFLILFTNLILETIKILNN